jgi:hypothetical protein
MTVSFSLDEYRRFVEAMNGQFLHAHTLGQEQAAQQFEHVLHQVLEYLAAVFREGQHWHDVSVRLQQEVTSLQTTLRNREQQEVWDRHELQARMAQAVSETERKVKIAAEIAFEAKMKEKEQDIQHLKGWLEKGEASWKEQQEANARMRSRLDE